MNRKLDITSLAGCTDVRATAEDVGLVLREKRAALREAMAQIDVSTSGAQARSILGHMVEEIDHDLTIMKGNADIVAALGAELGLHVDAVPVREASTAMPAGERL